MDIEILLRQSLDVVAVAVALAADSQTAVAAEDIVLVVDLVHRHCLELLGHLAEWQLADVG